ncbi:DUF1450 domain-containing protein [Neobacillus cucumis]|uniref:DUF1450 domain-containing protein n=1 Tax=Neobacillus cucumis TaxID=1740721 RepID=UPI002E250BAE|nr:DUF1450 domain-containing protein [Neobacillus cucumis]
MAERILYCFRNRLRELEEQIRQKLEEKEIDCSINPTYCMKLCIFCEKLNVAIVNQEIVMEKNKDQLITKILERIV